MALLCYPAVIVLKESKKKASCPIRTAVKAQATNLYRVVGFTCVWSLLSHCSPASFVLLFSIWRLFEENVCSEWVWLAGEQAGQQVGLAKGSSVAGRSTTQLGTSRDSESLLYADRQIPRNVISRLHFNIDGQQKEPSGGHLSSFSPQSILNSSHLDFSHLSLKFFI